MEDQQATTEPQQFENIDFNCSPDDNKDSNNEEHEQVTIISI